MKSLNEIAIAARTHYQNLQTDITNAKDRVEHIRLTALAQEAYNLLIDIENMQRAARETFNEPQEVLDLPDFKSPYNPDA